MYPFHWPEGLSSAASLGLTDYSQVDTLGVRYKFVTLERERARAHQMGEPKQTETELDLIAYRL
jgi:hypothetical protein